MTTGKRRRRRAKLKLNWMRRRKGEHSNQAEGEEERAVEAREREFNLSKVIDDRLTVALRAPHLRCH